MATGPGYPGGGGVSNVYIPNWEASGKLAVGFSRNPKKFRVMEYLQLVESPKNTGYYWRAAAQEAARYLGANDSDWARGSPRPRHPESLELFEYLPFTTKRRDEGFNLDEDTIDQAEWDIALQHAEIACAKLMTKRTIRCMTTLTTTSNWTAANDVMGDLSSDHTATATALAGGQFDLGTSLAPYFKKALDKIAVLINLDSLGVVTQDMLQVVLNPNTARLVAESPEVHDYIKGSYWAMDEIRKGSTPNAMYGPGLPSEMYNYKIVVENCVKVTSSKSGTAPPTQATKAFAFPDQTVGVVARVGALEGVFGLKSFSTLTGFWYRDEMTIERFPDPKNRLTEYHVCEDMTEVLTSALSGYLVTTATSVAS